MAEADAMASSSSGSESEEESIYEQLVLETVCAMCLGVYIEPLSCKECWHTYCRACVYGYLSYNAPADKKTPDERQRARATARSRKAVVGKPCPLCLRKNVPRGLKSEIPYVYLDGTNLVLDHQLDSLIADLLGPWFQGRRALYHELRFKQTYGASPLAWYLAVCRRRGVEPGRPLQLGRAQVAKELEGLKEGLQGASKRELLVAYVKLRAQRDADWQEPLQRLGGPPRAAPAQGRLVCVPSTDAFYARLSAPEPRVPPMAPAAWTQPRAPLPARLTTRLVALPRQDAPYLKRPFLRVSPKTAVKHLGTYLKGMLACPIDRTVHLYIKQLKLQPNHTIQFCIKQQRLPTNACVLVHYQIAPIKQV